MDLETGILSEVSQKEKHEYHMIPLICGLLKMVQTYLQNRNRATDVEKNLMVTKGEGGEWEINREIGVDTYVLPYMDS